MNKFNQDGKEFKLMNPKVDFVFKSIFGNQKHSKILVDFLNAVFRLTNDDKIVEVKIQNPHLDKKHMEDKYSILDVKAKANDNTLINIEIQVVKNDMIARSLYYLSKMISGQLKEKEDYSKILKTVTINLLDFIILKNTDRIHNAFFFKEYETNMLLTNLAEIHFIEFPKLGREQSVKELPLLDWIKFINFPESKEVEEIMKKNASIQEARNLLYNLSMDPEAREIYENREKAARDWYSSLEVAKNEGIEKGKAEIALKMLKSGMSIEDIVRFTGLADEMVQEILKKGKEL